MPYSEISNSDHQFFGSLKSKKKEDGFSRNNKSRFENIFVLGSEEALISKTNGIFE